MRRPSLDAGSPLGAKYLATVELVTLTAVLLAFPTASIRSGGLDTSGLHEG